MAGNARQSRTLAAAVATPLIGRTGITESLVTMLTARDGDRPTLPLVTLGGAPGIGKTRMALELMRRVSDAGRPAAFAYLGDLDNNPGQADEVELHAVARTIQEALGITEISSPDPVHVLITHLRRRDTARPGRAAGAQLVVIDNCERVKDAVGILVAILLAEAPGVQVLATSRGELGLPVEHYVPLTPLSIPGENATRGEDSEAMELFLHKVGAGGIEIPAGEWGAAVELVRWSGGLPLVLDMLAARLRRGLPPSGVLRRLDSGRLLTSSHARLAQPHHRTLARALDDSYEQCADGERRLLERLAVFAGEVHIEVVERVCAGEGIDPGEVVDLLGGLVDVALLIADGTGRYRILSPIREYALLKLQARGEEARWRDAHARHHRDWAATAAGSWLVPGPTDPDEMTLLTLADQEIDNFRAAMTWSLNHGDPETGLQIAVDLARLRLWWFSGRLPEGSTWIKRLMDACPTAPTPLLLAAAGMRGWMLLCQGDPTEAAALRHRCAGMLATLGLTDNPPPPVDFLDGAHKILAEGDIDGLALLRRAADGFAAAQAAGAPVAGDRHQVMLILGLSMGLLGGDEREVTAAADLILTEAAAGGARWAGSWGQWVRGLVPLTNGDPGAALTQFRACLSTQVALGDKWGSAWTLLAAVWALARLGAAEQAARLEGGSTRLQEDAGSRVEGLVPFHRQSAIARAATVDLIGEAAFRSHHALGRTLSDAEVYALAQQPPRTSTRRTPGGTATRMSDLTPMQRRVARLAAQNMTNKEIGEQLGSSARTVENHLGTVAAKLGVSGRGAVMLWVHTHDHADDTDHDTGSDAGPRSAP